MHLLICSVTQAVFGNKNKTFRPKKNFQKGTKLYQLHKYAKATVKATLGAGNLQEAVLLPEGEDKNEWLAVNTVDFFNQINLLFGSITEYCTRETCPCMSAGPQYEYHWADGVTIKKPIQCSASEYVDFLMTWVQQQLDDEAIFPSELGAYESTLCKRRALHTWVGTRVSCISGHVMWLLVQTAVSNGLRCHASTGRIARICSRAKRRG